MEDNVELLIFISEIAGESAFFARSQAAIAPITDFGFSDQFNRIHTACPPFHTGDIE